MHYFLTVIVLFSFPFYGQDRVDRDHQQMHRLHQDPEAYIAMLEDPERDAYQRPHEVIQALQLKAGEVIADIGAGSGYFTFRLAQHVGPNGRIYAVDIEPEMIRHVSRRARELQIMNVAPILADPDDPLLPGNSFDRVFICNTWHHIESQHQYLELLKKALRPEGQVVMIDFKKEELPVGPPLEMKIRREDLVEQMESSGFRLEAEHTFLPYQYFLVFRVK